MKKTKDFTVERSSVKIMRKTRGYFVAFKHPAIIKKIKKRRNEKTYRGSYDFVGILVEIITLFFTLAIFIALRVVWQRE